MRVKTKVKSGMAVIGGTGTSASDISLPIIGGTGRSATDICVPIIGGTGKTSIG